MKERMIELFWKLLVFALIFCGLLFPLCVKGVAQERARISLKDVQETFRLIDEEYIEKVDQKKLFQAFIEGLEEVLDRARILTNAFKQLKVSESIQENIKNLEAPLDALLKNSHGKLTMEILLYPALSRMISSLGDEETKFYKPGEYRPRLADMGYSLGGVGMYVDEERDKDGTFVVVETLAEFPSEKAGLRTGDRVVKVDGRSVGNLDFHQLADLVRGPIGTKVTLAIKKSGSDKTTDYTLERVWLNPNPKCLVSSVLPGLIGYMRFKCLGKRMELEVRQALASFEKQGVKGIIMDLRNNAGYVDGSMTVAELFLPRGTHIFTTVLKNNEEEHRALEERVCNLPVVILINEYSASASSVLAGALSDAKIATLVGAPTKWKSGLTSPFYLEDGSTVNLTIGFYRLPGGKILRNKGEAIKPDFLVPQEPLRAVSPEEDAQLRKAREVLTKMFGSPPAQEGQEPSKQ